jgi:transcription antitermination factor NusB
MIVFDLFEQDPNFRKPVEYETRKQYGTVNLANFIKAYERSQPVQFDFPGGKSYKLTKQWVDMLADYYNTLETNNDKAQLVYDVLTDYNKTIRLLNELSQSKLFEKYMSTNKSSFEEDKQFVIDMFTELIAPNEKLYEYLEDDKLTWIDDIPLVNTQILKQLQQISENSDFNVPKLYKDEEDKEFVSSLFRKTVLNEVELAKQYIDKTPNWDADRIAEIDTIILKMAICEFFKFPSIPIKVTINEYLEIAKEYSTPKSSIFINGILDNLVKEFQTQNKIVKTGRGLM